MKTLAVRLKAIEESALELARWLATRPEIELVLHPALPSCPGHELWKRDFTGSAGVFSVVFQPPFSKHKCWRLWIGWSCSRSDTAGAGVTSLAVAYDFHSIPNRPDYGHRIVRLNIGLGGCGGFEGGSDAGAGVAQVARYLPFNSPAETVASASDTDW